MILEVAQVGEAVLATPAEPVPLEMIGTPEFQGFLDDMIETMRERVGVGIAAPQVFRSLRVIVVECRGDNPRYPQIPEIALQIWINPEVHESGGELSEFVEGCLSVPERRISIARPEWLRLSALDRTGTPRTFVATGLLARILQHELDHIGGVLITDRAPTTAEVPSGVSS